MTPLELAQAFREGRVSGPRGPVRALAALLTRRSLLVFTQQTVLKMRLPGEVAGVDQTDHSSRLGMAEHERFIGRMLAPHAYLDDCALQIGADNQLRIVADDLEAEPIVATWRQPAERRADALILDGDARVESFELAMARLAQFHETAREPPMDERARHAERPRERWRAALERLGRLPGEVVSADELRRLGDETEAWLAALDKMLWHRISERRLREGHGELALEHIFLVDPPVFIDPSDEAASGEAYIDTAEDVMRLGMELDLAVGADFSDGVMQAYARHALDHKLMAVAPLYKRLAAVRVAGEAFADPTLEDRYGQARELVELALGYVSGAT